MLAIYKANEDIELSETDSVVVVDDDTAQFVADEVLYPGGIDHGRATDTGLSIKPSDLTDEQRWYLGRDGWCTLD